MSLRLICKQLLIKRVKAEFALSETKRNDPVDEYTEDMSITDDMMPAFADKNELENRIDTIINNAL